MLPLQRVGSAIVRSRTAFRQSQRWHSSKGYAFAADDYVLLIQTGNGTKSTKGRMGRDGERLIKLQTNNTVHGHRGVIPHNDIIGKRHRDVIQTATSSTFRLQDPTLSEYVRLTRRLAAPLYGFDASTIVSLLDLHPPHADSPPLEILEAGTGHGSLTLHLLSAIHAANPPKPQPAPTSNNDSNTEDTPNNEQESNDVASDAMEEWRKNRRAIVHTIDIHEPHSKHAQKIVRGFRRGLYDGAADFYIGDVSAWITKQLEIRGSNEPFLDYVILDLASAEDHLQAVSDALRPGGMVAVFNPSITQIVEIESAMRARGLPFAQDQVVELAPPRLWQVMVVRPRKWARMNATEQVNDETEDDSELDTDTSPVLPDGDAENAVLDRSTEPALDASNAEKEWVTVARPQFYGRTSGNGFLGLWYKKGDTILNGAKNDAETEKEKKIKILRTTRL